MKLTYYHAPFACSMVSYLALLEAGATFELVPVSLKKGEQKTEAYLALNPKGKVPLLVANGQTISENTAILSFLDSLFPTAKLLPSALMERTQAISWMSWCSSGLHPPITRIAKPGNFCDAPNSEESLKRLAIAEQLRNFAIIDGKLAGREWVFDHWTAVDGYLFWVWRRFAMVSGADLSVFPAYAAHAERMGARPSVVKTLVLEAQLAGD
ncbi:MAG: glutathione S-transferase family protein [Rhodocyclaceae bacterium]|nr:MAG: glutathione S-transferase family protein [Rhodocyclaceae bacterium]